MDSTDGAARVARPIEVDGDFEPFEEIAAPMLDEKVFWIRKAIGLQIHLGASVPRVRASDVVMKIQIMLALPLLVACANEPPATHVSSTTAASAAPVTPATDTAGIKVGSPAPDFDLTASDGTKLALKSLKGKPVVLYFYPKDETPGCTTEACSFRDAWEALQKSGVVMIGVSTDDAAAHKAFTDHHKLPFKLVSDPQGTLAKSYGVDTMSTPMGMLLQRQTIVIDKDGNVKKVYRTVDVTKHAQEITADVAG